MFIVFCFIRPLREAEKSCMFVEMNNLHTMVGQFPINTLIERIPNSKIYGRFTQANFVVFSWFISSRSLDPGNKALRKF